MKREEETFLLPLKGVQVDGSIVGSIATLDICLTYLNEYEGQSLECTYEFPLEKETIVSNFVAKIGDKEIIAKVREKETAEEMYDDAMAGGHSAVIAERQSEKHETILIKLGNLLPQQAAVLRLQLILPVQVVAGSYKFTLPACFYPNYKKMGAPVKQDYTFAYNLNVNSTKKITQISVPDSAETHASDDGTCITIKC